MTAQIPLLLEPSLGLPSEASLVLFTDVLGTTANWLVQRQVCSLLRSTEDSVQVLLVSFLRDYQFWRDGFGRLGLDLDYLARQGRFGFVDGMSNLFCSMSSGLSTEPPLAIGYRAIEQANLRHVQSVLNDAVKDLQGRLSDTKTILILEHPDLLLAASGKESSSESLRDCIFHIRERVHSTIAMVATDESLIATQSNLLEKEHAGLTLSLAHEAHTIFGLRQLDTGIAKDVSGVVRITQGGCNVDERVVEEQELLYFVSGDGNVRVFERGS